MFENSQQFIDLLINRRNFAESSAGRVTFWNPSKVIEGQGNKDCQLGNGETYTLLPTAKKEEALDYVVLPEVKGRNLFEIMEVFMQMMQLESGVINAMDQQASGLPSAKLATGVRSVDKSSSEMFSLFLEDLEPSLTEVLKAAVKIVYANMDATEIFTVTEGNAKVLLQLTPDAVRNLEIDVEMTLTKSKSEQVLESNVQAANLTNQFYSLAPAVQVHVASLYIQALKAMGIEQAETVIVPMPPPAPPQAGPDGQPVQDAEEAGEPPNGQKPSANIPINDPGQIMPVR